MGAPLAWMVVESSSPQTAPSAVCEEKGPFGGALSIPSSFGLCTLGGVSVPPTALLADLICCPSLLM